MSEGLARPPDRQRRRSALTLPEQVAVARPMGIGPADAMVTEISIDGREDWPAACAPRARHPLVRRRATPFEVRPGAPLRLAARRR